MFGLTLLKNDSCCRCRRREARRRLQRSNKAIGSTVQDGATLRLEHIIISNNDEFLCSGFGCQAMKISIHHGSRFGYCAANREC